MESAVEPLRQLLLAPEEVFHADALGLKEKENVRRNMNKNARKNIKRGIWEREGVSKLKSKIFESPG